MARSLSRLASVAAIALLAILGMASPVRAHEEGETAEGYLLVQEALGHLAHDASMSGIELATEKVDDALETGDQEGVDVTLLEQGRSALDAGDVDRARALLQESIQGATAMLPSATGSQTGTHEITPGLQGRPDLRAQDWVFLTFSVVALLLGAWLAFLFRPRDTIRTLRSRLAGAPAAARGEGKKGT